VTNKQQVPLCIYHKSCSDGFAAACIVFQALHGNVELYAGTYQDDPPDVTDRKVIIVDFSYKRDVLLKMAESAKHIIIIDHHKSAQEDLRDLNQTNIFCIFDMEHCGAMLTWDFYFPRKIIPEFIEYIQDRDLWTNKLPSINEFTMGLRAYPQDLQVWSVFFTDGAINFLIEEGGIILRYYRQQVEAAKRHAYPALIAGIKFWIVNAPGSMASEIAGELAEEHEGYGACFNQSSPNEWTYSLRARKGNDVIKIAQEYGGGGHAGAAGFRVHNLVHVPVETIHYEAKLSG